MRFRRWTLAAAIIVPSCILGFLISGGFRAPPEEFPLSAGGVSPPPTTVSASSTPEPTTPGTSPPTTTAPAPTTTVTAPVITSRPRREVSVVVFNASGVAGRATALTDVLGNAGYSVLPAGNRTDRPETSSVLWTDGFESEAQEMAGVLGLTPAHAMSIGNRLAVAELTGARVAVILGRDLAG